MDSIPLNFLAPGDTAWIDRILGTAEQVQRMEELGMRCGTCVEMVRPGLACIVCREGRRFCFRGSDALCIMVRTLAAQSRPADAAEAVETAYREKLAV